MIIRWSSLLVFALVVMTGFTDGCICPEATILSEFPSEVPAHLCCLNFSGSAFSHVHWSVFTNETNTEILDLSNCNISSISADEERPSALQRLFLNRNKLKVLPENFLSGLFNLTEVDLSENFLQELPESFLQSSENLQRLNLRQNDLRSLPGAILQVTSLHSLELDGNSWDCSCLLLNSLHDGRGANRTTKLQDLVGNLTCFSPWHLVGRSVWSVSLSDVCRPAGLIALFIVLPLLGLTALLLCWCCGRTRKKKETPVFSISKKRASNINNQKHPNKQPPSINEKDKAGNPGKEGILKNHHLLRPASALLGSNRDIYEEVEIKLSSVESLPQVSSQCSSPAEWKQEPDRTSRAELDTVSVTEVLKDSADREKAYMTQSTEYYSLVPGIELEDSDHGEYENVTIS